MTHFKHNNVGLSSLLDIGFDEALTKAFAQAAELTKRPAKHPVVARAIQRVQQRELGLYAAIDDLQSAMDDGLALGLLLERVLCRFDAFGHDLMALDKMVSPKPVALVA